MFFSSRGGHTRFKCDWSSEVCSADLCVTVRLAGVKVAVKLPVAAGLTVSERAPVWVGYPELDSRRVMEVSPVAVAPSVAMVRVEVIEELTSTGLNSTHTCLSSAVSCSDSKISTSRITGEL